MITFYNCGKGSGIFYQTKKEVSLGKKIKIKQPNFLRGLQIYFETQKKILVKLIETLSKCLQCRANLKQELNILLAIANLWERFGERNDELISPS